MDDLPAGLVGAMRDRYVLERELGRGGMATVWLARDLRHGREVALKVLRPELTASLGPERFTREIRIAAGLAQPRILPVFDSGAVDGFLYYAMPYVKGESLRARLSREVQLPLEPALRPKSPRRSRTRMSTRRRDTAAAGQNYERFLTRYDAPVPALRHLVVEAREALGRLAGVPTPAAEP